MFFFTKKPPQKIPLIKELLFMDCYHLFRYIENWEQIKFSSYDEIECKVRAELFGLTVIEQYSDVKNFDGLFRPKYKKEYKPMEPYRTNIFSEAEIIMETYDEKFMQLYASYKKYIKKEDPSFYKRLLTAEKESTTKLDVYTGPLDTDAYEKEYNSRMESYSNQAFINNYAFFEKMDKEREEQERLQELEWELEEERRAQFAYQQKLEASSEYQVKKALDEYVNQGFKLAIDTNILMDYPTLLKLYPNDILFSKKVFDELDGLKSDHGQRGKLARAFFRHYETLQNEGIIVPFIPVDIHYCKKIQLDAKKPDELILSTYLKYRERHPNVLFLSKDRGARILAKNFHLDVLDGDIMKYFIEQ